MSESLKSVINKLIEKEDKDFIDYLKSLNNGDNFALEIYGISKKGEL